MAKLGHSAGGQGSVGPPAGAARPAVSKRESKPAVMQASALHELFWTDHTQPLGGQGSVGPPAGAARPAVSKRESKPAVMQATAMHELF